MNTAVVTLLGKHGGVVRKYRKVTKRRFSGIIKAVPHSELIVRVDYKDGGWNEGQYANDEEAKLAIEAFLES